MPIFTDEMGATNMCKPHFRDLRGRSEVALKTL